MLRTTHRSKRERATLTVELLERRDCPAVYSIVDLLPAPGGLQSSDAYGLNDSGTVVGRTLHTSGYGQATVWQTGAAATASGMLLPKLSASDNISEAVDVNNDGVIAGNSGDVSSTTHAVVWVGASHVVRDLGALPGFTDSRAVDLSELDDNKVTWVVGGTYGSGTAHATVWRIDSAGNVLSSIDLEPTKTWTSAHGVQVVGESVYVAGYYSLGGDNGMARKWTLNLDGNVLSRTDLGTLGGPSSDGWAVNAAGHVAGSSLATDGTNYAFIHRDGVMTSLGSLGDKGSAASAINDSDTVVGTYWSSSKNGSPWRSNAFVWEGHTMFDLRSQLAPQNRANWSRLYGAYDVNATGEIVGGGYVNVGKNRSEHHAYLAVPPALAASEIGAANDAAQISPMQVRPLLSEAAARWEAAGGDKSLITDIPVHIADLGGTTLGLVSGNTIWLDDNAAGWGWFVDSTPWDDSEFASPGNQGEQEHMDLLTVLVHELGHLLGHDHDAEGVMAETLAAGARRTQLELDDVARVDQAFERMGNQPDFARLGTWLSEQFDSAHSRAKLR